MAKKSPCSPGKASSQVPPKVQGRLFLLDGKMKSQERERLQELIEGEGGQVSPTLTPAVDHVVLAATRGSSGRSSLEKEVERLNAAGASIRVLTAGGCLDLLLHLTREEALALLIGPARDHDRFGRLLPPWRSDERIDLSGADLRNADLRKVSFARADITGADLRGADLREAGLHDVARLLLEGARLDQAILSGVRECSFDRLSLRGVRVMWHALHDCSFRGADLTEASCYTARLERCDLSDARLTRGTFRSSKADALVARNADLEGARLGDAAWPRADLTGANLREAVLQGADLTGATLRKACLALATLAKAKLMNADLRDADLRHASLVGADLTGAKIRGANFEGANLRGCKLDGLDLSQARGLRQPSPPAPGAHLRALERSGKSYRSLLTSIAVEVGSLGDVRLTATSHASGATVGGHERVAGVVRSWTSSGTSAAPSLPQVMLDLAEPWRGGLVRPGTVEVQASPVPRGQARKDLERAALAAWCEAFELPLPSAEDAAQSREAEGQRQEEARRAVLGLLRQGKAGVQKWNALTPGERDALGDCAGVDLTGTSLEGITLNGFQGTGACLARANLTGASLGHARLRKASLKGACLSRVYGLHADLFEADLERADLRDAQLRYASLRKASLVQANLEKTDLRGADLRGADLTGARLAGARLARARHDADTRLPAGLDTSQMAWAGKKAAPAPTVSPSAAIPKSEALDFQAFLQHLPRLCDTGRIANALTMLKAERFQLYSQVEEGHVLGVVRSQSTRDRVYSCRLDSNGTYACCTQSLRHCGGLGGSPCKHLLVLLVGLAKAGELEPGTAAYWLGLARGKRAELNREVMSETFLRYKGAEAGEVDWRPTETIPEDFYAL